MEWIKCEDRSGRYLEKDDGWYVVLIGGNVHVAYFGHRNWQRPWHVPDEWQEPTHYIKLDSIEDVWSNVRSTITMD